ncbi:bifunctional diguanylate cyclase/phosphodiesterase [Aliidongia dinghuensis]|uniref:Bifunctional diguanylate cyclase/phosphodiesterase n=1 Tax=Aliidongia dinghuensis TaxID=1867774 RepID=A0A8J2YYE2_9PROT|nr:EAL domain-containing protein [Aliidongia dinghuensis]GGF36254.1 bifunctional diguanylate cyclase/phosphodiesterase [Aliidongia dinghuensis]
MLQVLACITQQHDLRLVALAAFICVLATYTAFTLVGRAQEAPPRGRAAWITTAAVATGSGVWATHFIAMLAFEPDLPVSYMVDRTILSIIIAVLISGVGLGIAMSQRLDLRLLGGFVTGAGIGAMHYTGMWAVRLPGVLTYNLGPLSASLIVGTLMGGVATMAGFARRDFRHRVAGALLLTLAICAMHFTGMSAVVIVPDASLPVPEATIAPFWLATAVTAVTILILALGLVGSTVDQHLASRSMREAERLRASEQRFRQLADATFEGIVIHIEGEIVDANLAMCTLLDRPLDQLVGQQIWEVVAPANHELVRERIAAESTETQEIDLCDANGRTIPVEILAQTIPFGTGTARVVAVRDIRERREAEARIRHMAHHDALTGLPNRTLFHDRLEQAVSLAKRNGTTVAVHCLDLDRFKNVNDLMGHAAGDALLQQVARHLNNSVRAHDTVARLSGDEFAIIQIGVTHPDGPAILADRLVELIGQPFDLDEQQVIIGTSIGVALYPGDSESGEELVRAADTALYRAKAAGRGTYRFFEPEMDTRLQERRLLERDLRQALAEGQLEVHYQPLVECNSEALLGFEALVRWRHPERGQVPPSEFIPVAEESGLIIQLGEWVMRTACREAAKWPGDQRIAINLSPVQFRHADLAHKILTIVEQTGLAPERLELEITEGVLIEDTEHTLATLSLLKSAGIRVSLDDFGTGYSSLSYLQRFPFDKIKIDRSFVWEMGRNADSMAIVRSVIALGRSLRITVIAEGVETPEQLALLQSEQCDQVQGFLLGRPVPARDLTQLMTDAETAAAE